MAANEDDDRIRSKAHELWEAEGRPHGREADHWAEAREIIAIRDSNQATLLPRDFGAEEPIEEADVALRNLADFPNLTDQGENLLTSTDRETGPVPTIEVPTSDQPGVPTKAAGKSSGVSPGKPNEDDGSPAKTSTATSKPSRGAKSAPAKPGIAKASAKTETKTSSTPKKPRG